MLKGIIQLCGRKIIDAKSASVWDKYVFDDTYREFCLQAQQFDQQKKYTTFQEILKNEPKADQMHYLVSTAAIGYIRQLNGKMPDVVSVFSKPCVPFKNFRFEIVQSHIEDKALHKVVIYFYGEPLIWIDTINGNQLLFAMGDQLESFNSGKKVETEILVMSSNLSISSFQQNNFLPL
ncbi:MAG: hypothetical protein C0490_00995 [Marivirga sp.]|nr:hypothetical protein [Marivirga sp.]